MTTAKPNVVLLLADDLGYSDLGCYGGEIDTPALDALGRGGVRLSQFCTTPRCSPSRAALMTGQYPHLTGVGDLANDDRPWGYPGALSSSYPTMAEALSAAGYATGLFGKWHLSTRVRKPDISWPTRRGFDEFYGIISGATNYFTPRYLFQNETRIDADDPDYYFTEAIGQHAAEFIGRHAGAGDPFFCYVPFTAPHFPLHAPEADVAAYAGRFDIGWERLRERRLHKMKQERILPPEVELTAPEAGRRAWEDIPDQEWQARRMQVYAAQVTAMDRAVHTVVSTLERTGVLDNTLIIFFSDNGGCAEPAPGPRSGGPLTTGAGDPVLVGNDPSIIPGAENTHCSYGPDWARVSNTPFRLFKRWTHQGGIASPFIVHWPSGELCNGSVVDHRYHVIDVLPTVLAAADAAGRVHGVSGDGRSMLPSLRGGREPTAVWRFWEHIGNAAVEYDGWKLVRESGRPWELYDLAEDRTESIDLAERHPDTVEAYARRWQAWAERVGVIAFDTIAEEYRARGRYLPHDRALEL